MKNGINWRHASEERKMIGYSIPSDIIISLYILLLLLSTFAIFVTHTAEQILIVIYVFNILYQVRFSFISGMSALLSKIISFVSTPYTSNQPANNNKNHFLCRCWVLFSGFYFSFNMPFISSLSFRWMTYEISQH